MQLGVDIVGLETQMVQPAALVVQELGHPGIRADRLKQLDLALADGQQGGFDALVFDRCHFAQRQAQDITIKRVGVFEIADDNADVVNF